MPEGAINPHEVPEGAHKTRLIHKKKEKHYETIIINNRNINANS